MQFPECRPVGYKWLSQKFGIISLPYWRESFLLNKGAKRVVERDGRHIEFFLPSQDPGEGVFAHLEFALKKEGLHLELLRKVLPRLSSDEVAEYVLTKRTGRYARTIWWLYESFVNVLPLPDLETGNYFDLLDSAIYVVGPEVKVRRQRINVNLIGSPDFSPMVRISALGGVDEEDLRRRCEEILGDYPPEVFQRAVRYLYAKESKSSYEIEKEIPSQRRAEAFIALLEQAWVRSFLKKEALVELQKAIVDPRFATGGWRNEIDEQVYVGETLGPNLERVHYVAPKPENIEELMEAFLAMSRRITNRRVRTTAGTVVTVRSNFPTLVAAAIVSFVFDFLHPFSDGNGRIHRFLLHHVLARNGFGPEGIIFPVSAVILSRPREYDQALESFSKPLMELLEYTMDDRQRVTVINDTTDFYRYIDCTELTKITIEFIRETIETELPAELRYLANYDEIRAKMRDVADVPNRIADLFVKLCRQNNGRLSNKKRGHPDFAQLTSEEMNQWEEIVKSGLGLSGSD